MSFIRDRSNSIGESALADQAKQETDRPVVEESTGSGGNKSSIGKYRLSSIISPSRHLFGNGEEDKSSGDLLSTGGQNGVSNWLAGPRC